MNKLYGLLVGTLMFFLLCTAGCDLVGHDNGEAYEAYTEAMEEYRREG